MNRRFTDCSRVMRVRIVKASGARGQGPEVRGQRSEVRAATDVVLAFDFWPLALPFSGTADHGRWFFVGMPRTHDLSVLSPIAVGAWELSNRVVLAPLTRSRAGAGNAPTPLNAAYYAQRASAGLMISEATQISPQGVGYLHTPGIHTDEQVAGWRLVTDAVHARGGRIVLQLWHVGRISHPSLQPDGALPVAPSAIAPDGNAPTPTGFQPYVTPRALEMVELPGIIEQYTDGARRAKAAGFDGVEVHGANGYLLDQFLRDGTNRRTDSYGGSLPNRVRLLREVTEAVIDMWGPDRVGVRLSPTMPNNSMSDSDPVTTAVAAARALDELGVAYLHLREPAHLAAGAPWALPAVRTAFGRALMVNDGYDRATADRIIASGQADLVAFGKLYIANPDLVDRFRRGMALNVPDSTTFYGGDAQGYTDYPVLGDSPPLARIA
jgi:N-ethylmaleimide reductase